MRGKQGDRPQEERRESGFLACSATAADVKKSNIITNLRGGGGY